MNAPTFQASAVVKVTEGINVTGNVTRGFRAANMADFGAVGLTGGGGFEISPTQARELNGLVGTTGATGAVSTGEVAGGLNPEVVYQYDLGVKGRVGKVSGSITGFDLELYDFIQRRALVFESSIVGTVISGFTVVRQDATGLAYIAQDARPIATRVNTDRGRIQGIDAEGEVRVTPAWTASAFFSMANGRTLPAGEYSRRMNPPMGGAKLRWLHNRLWAEGVLTFAAEQTRLNSGDITDARIGANRTRAQIATFFNGTATDRGLVQNGILLETGETLAQVQNRVLGTANAAPLFTTRAGLRGVQPPRRRAAGPGLRPHAHRREHRRRELSALRLRPRRAGLQPAVPHPLPFLRVMAGKTERPGTTRARDLYLASALLPLVPGAGSIVAAMEPGQWTGLTPSLVRGVTPDALLYSAACVVVAAPLAGVAIASSRRAAPPGASAWPAAIADAQRLAIATAIFAAVSAVLTFMRLGGGEDALRFVATSHAVLASVTLALAALGALLGTIFRDPLDAAAVALGLAATAGYGILVAGAPVGLASAPVLTAALLASPVMSVASAAQVDLVRSDIWYQISPLAHVQVEYPTWGAVCVAYLLAGCAALLGMAWRSGHDRVRALEQRL